MDLLLKREQKRNPFGRVVFELWAKTEMNEDERALIDRYHLDESYLLVADDRGHLKWAWIIGIITFVIVAGAVTRANSLEQGLPSGLLVGAIVGVPYLVGGPELTACPGRWPVVSNVADESNPFVAGEFRLGMNQRENCPGRGAAEKMSGGITPGPATAALHYNDVDSASDTHLGLFNFMWAGLRIADLTDPANPHEVAYFKPDDICTGHVHYLNDTGHIWLTCSASGFWVLELSPLVRRAGGLHLRRKQ